MQNIKRLKMMAAVGIVACAVSLGGCAQQGRYMAPGPNDARQTPGLTAPAPQLQNVNPGDRNNVLPRDNRANLLGGNMNTSPQAITPMSQNADPQKAKAIESQLQKMPQVNNANCVVNGDTAVVGYTPSGNGKDVNATKNAIIDQVKKLYPDVKNVSVSEDVNIINQIRRMADDITNNRTLDQVGRDIQDLAKRINPMMR